MIACTSPAGTASDTPFRIGLSATVAWRLVISSISSEFSGNVSNFVGVVPAVAPCFKDATSIRLQFWFCFELSEGNEVVAVIRSVADEALQHLSQFELRH